MASARPNPVAARFRDLHFTDTGYALYANVFIDAIDQQLGVQIPHADVDAVHADDALAPSKLRAAGFTCVPAM